MHGVVRWQDYGTRRRLRQSVRLQLLRQGRRGGRRMRHVLRSRLQQHMRDNGRLRHRLHDARPTHVQYATERIRLQRRNVHWPLQRGSHGLRRRRHVHAAGGLPNRLADCRLPAGNVHPASARPEL